VASVACADSEQMADSSCSFATGGDFECAEVVGEVGFYFGPLLVVLALAYVSYAFVFDRSRVLEYFFDVARFVVKSNRCLVLCQK
jgi:hypothetical protein